MPRNAGTGRLEAHRAPLLFGAALYKRGARRTPSQRANAKHGQPRTMGAADAGDAAMVSPVVLAQRKRRAHAQQNPPAVTPRDGAMTWEKRNNSLDDLRKQLRQRPARIRDAPTTPPEECRTVRRALAAQRALSVDSLAAECAARLAMATNEDYSENPLNRYADLEESLSNLKRALQDAAKAVEAEEAAIEGEARTLHEVEADMRACTQRLLAGDTTVASKLEALDLELDSHASKQVREEERNELWDLREAPANALCLARTRRLVPRDVASSSIKVLRRLYASALPDNLDASRKLARRVFHTPALWLVHATEKDLSGMHEADLTRKYDCTQLDVVELRAVYGAVRPIRWRDVKGHADGRAAWRKAARDRLVALVDRERRGALRPHETRRPEYACFDATRVDLDAVVVVDVADLDVMETDSASFDGLSGHSLGA